MNIINGRISEQKVISNNDDEQYTVDTDQSAIQVVDNRSSTIAHRKMQAIADNSSQIARQDALQQKANNRSQSRPAVEMKAVVSNQPSSSEPIMRKTNPQASSIIQRTKWEHDGHKWNITSTSTKDTDQHPHPNKAYPIANKGDVYDQNTGVYDSPLHNALINIGASSGRISFYDTRSTTGFKYASGKNRQGPHTLAHITKRVAMGAAEQIGRDSLKLRGSRAFPRPRIMNKLLRDRLKSRGKNWAKDTREMRTQYLNNYRRQWRYSQIKAKRQDRLTALRRGMELNPSTVYNIGKGSATDAEMSGKGESRGIGSNDLIKLIGTTGSLTSKKISGLSTMDLSGATALEKQGALGMTEDIRNLLMMDSVEEDSGESESDSELSDLDDV